MDGSIDEVWDNEEIRRINLRRSLFLPTTFIRDAKTAEHVCGPDTGFGEIVFDLNGNTDNLVNQALTNARNLDETSQKIFDVINNPKEFAENEWLSFLDIDEWGVSGDKYLDYYELIQNEETRLDKAPIRIPAYPHEYQDVRGEEYVEDTINKTASVGGASYYSFGQIPVAGSDRWDGAVDGKPAFPLSDEMLQKLKEEENPVVDPHTQSMAAIYCDLDAMEKDNSSFLRFRLPDMRTYYVLE